MTEQLNGVDGKILGALKENSRNNVSVIARKLSIPRSTVAERIKKLETDGVIKGYTVRMDHKKVGNSATVFVLVRIRPDPKVRHQNITLSREIAKIDGIEEVHLVSGEWDVILKARGPSLEGIFETIMEELRRKPGIDRTQTMSCFTTVTEPL